MNTAVVGAMLPSESAVAGTNLPVAGLGAIIVRDKIPDAEFTRAIERGLVRGGLVRVHPSKDGQLGGRTCSVDPRLVAAVKEHHPRVEWHRTRKKYQLHALFKPAPVFAGTVHGKLVALLAPRN